MIKYIIDILFFGYILRKDVVCKNDDCLKKVRAYVKPNALREGFIGCVGFCGI